jgi:hypothetical protein
MAGLEEPLHRRHFGLGALIPRRSDDGFQVVAAKRALDVRARLTIDITVARRIPAPADAIFSACLDPKTPGGPWFGVARVILNPVVDGLFYHAVEHEGRTWPHYGRFIRLDRPSRIEHTWVSEATKGVESVVTVTL